jgi:signal transduction histidine kinase
MDRTAAHPDRPIDLGPLVAGVARDLEMPTGDMIPGTIPVVVQDGCVVVADPVVLQHVLVSLVDNAQRHGALPVKVEVERDGERVILSVIEAGPGIRPADRERVFERFSRSNGGGRGGMTLGLPIVRDLVSGLGGTVELGEGPEGGVAARVSLPGPGRFGSPA